MWIIFNIGVALTSCICKRYYLVVFCRQRSTTCRLTRPGRIATALFRAQIKSGHLTPKNQIMNNSWSCSSRGNMLQKLGIARSVMHSWVYDFKRVEWWEFTGTSLFVLKELAFLSFDVIYQNLGSSQVRGGQPCKVEDNFNSNSWWPKGNLKNFVKCNEHFI